jgi:DNA-binding FadR family transcriptional regulator
MTVTSIVAVLSGRPAVGRLGTTGLHGELLDKLGRALASHELAAGTVLRAEELEARYGVSRTVVRETIRVLESMGVVSSRRRVGTTVEPRPLERLRPHGDPMAAGRARHGGGRGAVGGTRHGLMPAKPEPAAIRLHADVAEAVQASDPTGARRAMQAIIEEAVEAMLGGTDSAPAAR